MSTPPYSRARRAGPLLVTAGLLGRGVDDLAEGFEAQLEAALENLEDLLAGEGLTERDVVRLVVYVVDLGDMDVLNRVFSARFSEPRPARTAVEVSALPAGARVEIEATAAVA